jgi:dihydrolipoamide dehydrogenase
VKKYDVVIIGAGTAGLSARKEVRKHTENYLVVDDGILGTTCARVGCMPSKVLIQVANDFYRREKFPTMGIQGGEHLQIDPKAVFQHVRQLRDRFTGGVLRSMENWQKTHFKAKRATFMDANTLDLGDEKVQADKIIIATGSRPIMPRAWAPFKKYFLDTDTFFEQEVLPQKIAVIGLGVIGLELGQALHRLGFEVTGIGKGKAIGGLTDPFMQNYTCDKFSKEMNVSFDGVDEVSEKNGQLALKTQQGEVLADKVLLAMGRRPNIDNLGIENLGVVLNPQGIPEFDNNTFQVGNLPVFIAGDVNGVRPILHEASDEGHIAGYNAMQSSPQCFRRRVSLAITFSYPNIATIGKTYQQLTDEKIEFDLGEVSFEGQGRSIVKMTEKGHLRVYGEKGTGKILGAELFGPDGEHLAHLIAWAISLNLTAGEVVRLPFYHPVVEEGLRTAMRKLASKSPAASSPLEVLRCGDVPVEDRD